MKNETKVAPRKSPVLVYQKPVNQVPPIDTKEDAFHELNESVADLATEVGGSQKQGSPVYNATARVQEALRVYTEATQ